MSSTNTTTIMASFLQNEEKIIKYSAYGMIIFAIVTALWLIFSKMPYGRYGDAKFGTLISGKVAWIVQVVPGLAVPLWCVFFTEAVQLRNVANVILVGMNIGHYFLRLFIFSVLQRSKPTPVGVSIFFFFFTGYNGYLQGRYLTKIAVYEDNYHLTPIFLLGCFLYVLGMAINIQSDQILRNLRKPGETGYKIPRGGMFDYISGANFFGESVEWVGYAIACWNLPAFAFAIMTVCNIGPRAFHHHKWYKQKFDDYPAQRKAFIPFVI